MTKLIEQLVSEKLHDISSTREGTPEFLEKTTPEILARTLLCEIAHEAHPAFVMKALAALSVAASVEGVHQRFKAVQDVRAEAFRSAGIDIEAEQRARKTASDEQARKFVDAIKSSFATVLGGTATALTASDAPDDTPGATPEAASPADNVGQAA